MSTTTTTKVAFPFPPPTSNTLTLNQRQQLQRKTKKLGQVFGTTPHVLDESYQLGPLHVHLPIGNAPEQRSRSIPCRRKSVDSDSSTSCSSLDSVSPTSSRASSRSLSRSPPRNSPDSLDGPVDPWQQQIHRPPLLRIALSSADSSPFNSPIVKPMVPVSPISPPPSYSTEDITYTLNVPRAQTTNSFYTEEPSFVIPTNSTTRREKMDRVKRKLGNGVPLDLVFPHRDSDIEPIPPIPSPPILSLSQHHHHQGPKRVTVHYGPNSSKTTKDNRLGSIIESADEHGGSCSEEFGYPPRPQKSIAPPPCISDDVDVDIDAMFRNLARNLTGKKLPWVKKVADETISSVWA